MPDPSNIFPNEQQNAAPPAQAMNIETITAIADPTHEIWILQSNIHQNFEVGGQGEDLLVQGIEIDNDNKSVVENAGPLPPNLLLKPSICPKRSLNLSNFPGNWRDKSWSEVADMDEFALFQMAFSESFLIEVLIPQTSKNIEGQALTLAEFYVWLWVNF